MNPVSIFRALAPALGAIAVTALMAFAINSLEERARLQGFNQAEAEGAAALDRLKQEHANENARAALQAASDAKEAARKLAEAQKRRDELASQLAEQKRQHRTTTDRLTGEIARVNDLYRTALDAQPEPLPACVFTRGFVRVWNEATGAISADLPATALPVGASAQSTDTGAIDQLPAGIGRAELLGHHVRYAEQCRNTAAQLDALIDAVQETP